MRWKSRCCGQFTVDITRPARISNGSVYACAAQKWRVHHFPGAVDIGPTGTGERMDTFEGKHAFPPLSSSPIAANHVDVVSGVNSVEPRVQATQSRKLHGRPI